MLGVSQERLFNDPNPQFQKWREKWCAAMFGLGYEKFLDPCQVAINATEQRQDADFFVEAAGREHPFQLVEALEPERRRGAEYKEFARGTRHSVPYEPARGHIEGPQWIADCIEKKVSKRYAGASHINLLVYANFPARELQHADVVTAAEPRTRNERTVGDDSAKSRDQPQNRAGLF